MNYREICLSAIHQTYAKIAHMVVKEHYAKNVTYGCGLDRQSEEGNVDR